MFSPHQVPSTSSSAQSPLLQHFPQAQALSYVYTPFALSSSDALELTPARVRDCLSLDRRDDLQDLLTDETYQAAFVNTLPQVEEAMKQVELLERENESLAGRFPSC